MAKKSHADIMEKLRALKPSEPTKTRQSAARKPARKKQKGKARPTPKKSMPQAQPAPPASAKEIPAVPGYGGKSLFGNTTQVYREVYDCWFRVIRNTNSLYMNSLSYLWDISKWRRY